MKRTVADSVLGLIGGTPMVHLGVLGGEDSLDGDGVRSLTPRAPDRSPDTALAAIFGKLEAANPGGSVKDRICWSMITAAERDGLITPRDGSTIIEPTSGNTGIGLALVCAAKGYKLILTMPEDMSVERRALLKSYGAELHLTAADLGMKGSVDRAEELCADTTSCFMPQQFNNPANPEIHRTTTAPEIIDAMGARTIDAFVAGVGTGGTITGVGEVLKKKNPEAQVIAVEPKNSAVLSGGRPGLHRIQGLGAGFIPSILNREIIDRIVTVEDEEAYEITQRLAKEEGLLVGISSGANVFAARQIATELGPGKNVVTVLCDTGERYFSLEKTFSA